MSLLGFPSPDQPNFEDAVTLRGPADVAGQPAGSFTPPGYELISEVGRGGMGVVYKARQLALGRIVALKMILLGELAGAEELRRFRMEAEATAGLDHAGIVAVYEVGEDAGRLYYSMAFIDGPTLAQRLAEGPLPGRQAARYVAKIARAIHHAHRHGILHRDLKPSNVLIDSEDQPHVADFGLAKRLAADSKQTKTGAVLGTPSYMAPEQAAGKVHELGPACDVYGLGAVLYELITGRPPFRSDTPLDTMLHVLERDPAPPRLLNPKIDRDLETICLKCLEKDPRRRYVSAEALAYDLERYLEDEPISARSTNLLDRLARTLERSQHVVEFRRYGAVLLWFAAIVFVTHVVIFAMTWEPPYPLFWISVARVLQFALMGAVFWYYRPQTLLPTTTAERQLWSVWIAYLIASFTVVAAARLAETPQRPLNELTLYPIFAVLSGAAFFALGSSYWGQCYTLGLAFFIAALIMPFSLRWAPLEFGVLWTISLAAIGFYLRRLGKEPTEKDGPHGAPFVA